MDGMPTVLVTGATSGIGAEAAVDLADRGWRVFVHGRDPDRGQDVVDRAERVGGEASFFRADFTDRAAVRDLAADVRDRLDGGLDALVLNAGLACDECRLGWGGIEETFAVNQVAPYLLTHDLAGSLAEAAPARVVVTSSAVHPRGELDFEDTGDIDCSGSYDALDAYARSKFANLVFTMELADRFAAENVTVNAFHPGFIPGSGLYRSLGPFFRTAITLSRVVPFVGMTVEKGAEGIVYLTDAAEVADTTGAYFHRRRRKEPDSRVSDPARRELLWSVCADVAGVDPDWP